MSTFWKVRSCCSFATQLHLHRTLHCLPNNWTITLWNVTTENMKHAIYSVRSVGRKRGLTVITNDKIISWCRHAAGDHQPLRLPLLLSGCDHGGGHQWRRGTEAHRRKRNTASQRKLSLMMCVNCTLFVCSVPWTRWASLQRRSMAATKLLEPSCTSVTWSSRRNREKSRPKRTAQRVWPTKHHHKDTTVSLYNGCRWCCLDRAFCCLAVCY